MFVIAVGLQEATTVVIGNSIGDGNTELARRYFKVTRTIVAFIFCAVALTLYLARVPITALFTHEPDVSALTIQVMYVVSIKHCFDGMQGYLQGVIRGLGL